MPNLESVTKPHDEVVSSKANIDNRIDHGMTQVHDVARNSRSEKTFPSCAQ
jgi:hypothetical protein